MNNKMKSLMYVIITLYMLNYVVSTTCMNINPSQISDCTNHKITQEELGSYTSEFSDADTCCYYRSVISGNEKVDCKPVKKSNESGVREKEKNNIKADAKKNGVTNCTFSLICDTNSNSDSDSNICEPETEPKLDSGKDNSIWLSLSLTFLFFGLLF